MYNSLYMYAVIKTGGKQYKVSEGDILVIDKIEKKPGEKVEFPEVLLLVDGDKVQIGQPTCPGTKVTAQVLEHFKGEKIRIARFKAKVRYRKVLGFRPLLTKIQIEKIETAEPTIQDRKPKPILDRKKRKKNE